jgi:thymidylate synthase
MNAIGSRISAVSKELWLHWQQTREQWADAKSEEFEKKYMLELMNSVDKTLTVIEQLDTIIEKIKKDCE